jgi:hypothetical protein
MERILENIFLTILCTPIILSFIFLIFISFESIYKFLFKEQSKVSAKVKEGLTYWQLIKVILFWVILILVVGLLCNEPKNDRYYEPTRF